MKRPLVVFLLALLTFCLLAGPVAAAESGEEPAFWDKAIVPISAALTGSVLTFLFNYFLAYRKQKNEPRKEISYSIAIKNSTPPMEKVGEKGLEIAYNGRKVKELYYVEVVAANTGNKVVKEQLLRFRFPVGMNILESVVDPGPPREWQVHQQPEWVVGSHEVSYTLGHLEKQKQVCFKFILTGEGSAIPVVEGFNKEGDVEISQGPVSKERDDIEKLRQFVYLFILFTTLPHLFDFFPSALMLGELLSGVTKIVLVVLMLRYVKSVTYILTEMLFRRRVSGDLATNYYAHETVIHGDIYSSRVGGLTDSGLESRIVSKEKPVHIPKDTPDHEHDRHAIE